MWKYIDSNYNSSNSFFLLTTMPSKNIGKWTSSSGWYSANLRLYEDKHFELILDVSYIIGTTYNANVTYSGTYKYFNGEITLIPDDEDIKYVGNFGDNRLTLRKVEDGKKGDFIEFKK